jgi:methionyl-tRNA formyltransferase
MRVIFMGTPEFSVGVLRALKEAEHEVVLAVTQPDKPKGRGEKYLYTPVKKEALDLGIPVFQPKRIRDAKAIELLSGYQADVFVVVAFGQILPQVILDLAPYGCINVHASLLPKYRGAAPIQWAILNGERVSGVTTMQMDAGLDTGDILQKKEMPLAKKETAGSLHDKLGAMGAELILETLDKLQTGKLIPQKQGESPTEYAKMITKEMGNIDWNFGANEIERRIRGLSPWPSAYTYLDGKMLKIWEADVLDTKASTLPGTIEIIEKDAIIVSTGKGMLRIKSLQLQGKKRMDADAFLRGNPLEISMTFERQGGV